MIKKIFSPLHKFLMHLKLRQRLLISYFILIIIPLGVFSVISFSNVNTVIEKHIIYSANHAFDQASEFIFYKINKVIKVSDVIALDNNMNSTLEKKLETYSLADQYKDMNDLRSYLHSFVDEADGIKMKLYVSDEFVYSKDDVTLLGFSDATKIKWYSILNASKDKILMCPSLYLDDGENDNSNTLSVVRKLKESNDFNVTLAYLQIDFLKDDIRRILSDANTTKGSFTYLQNSQGFMVSSTDPDSLNRLKVDFRASREVMGMEDWSTMHVNDEQTFVKVRAVPNTDWSIITVIPIKDIYIDINKLRNSMILLMLVIGTIAYITAVYISYTITKRIDILTNRMKSVQNGDLENATILVDSTDEIGELTQDYNYMIHKIIELIDEQYKSGEELKNAELRALQAQINPHFLYNTLDMINWMSYDDKGAEIRSLVKSLASFYKLSLNSGKDIVSIADELKHASLYVQIQNIRLNNKINFVIDVDDDIKQYSIIKITLQPIIENAILHGIMEKQGKAGTVHISARVIDKTILMTVSDDGVGIKPEQLGNIFANASSVYQIHGFSIKNIHERIKLYFGEKYGLTISSEYEKGTIVSIEIPILKTHIVENT